MFGTILLVVFVLLVIVVIYIEYKNTQKYKIEKEEKRRARKAPPSRVEPEKEVKKEEEEPKSDIVSEKPQEKTIVPEEVKTAPQPEVIEEKPVTIELPPCEYPPFDHSRTVESLGLSEEDAKEFVGELITQIDTHLPLIKKELDASDFHQLEKLTHSLKGSASSLGTGGVSDLLTDFNTYLKSGKETQIASHYIECLETYTQKLKAQYA